MKPLVETEEQRHTYLNAQVSRQVRGKYFELKSNDTFVSLFMVPNTKEVDSKKKINNATPASVLNSVKQSHNTRVAHTFFSVSRSMIATVKT